MTTDTERIYETIVHWDEGGGKRSRRELARRIVELQAEDKAGGHGWQPIETAPKDGSLIVVRGNNHGDAENGQHHCIACWFNGCWAEASDWNPTSKLTYLTDWMPLTAQQPAQVAQPQAVPAEKSDLYWRLHSLSKALEGSGCIYEDEMPDAYATILDAMRSAAPKEPGV